MNSEAFIHGRFQPFHNQHLEYFVEAKKRCRFLWIGIAKPILDFTVNEFNIAPHREDSSANPLTYFERVKVIEKSVLDFGAGRAEFGFFPFFIDQPALVSNFIDINIQCFTTICDEWNIHKIKTLRDLGYDVISLIDRLGQRPETLISGRSIRLRAAQKDKSWQKDIPSGGLKYLIDIDFEQRMSIIDIK